MGAPLRGPDRVEWVTGIVSRQMDEPELLTVQRSLNAAQRERRAGMIRAAMELAREGGYEAVMMKEVAARSGVALGTLYRYFGSKDHLLAEALVAWGAELGDSLRQHPPQGERAAERVAEMFRRMTVGLEQQPQLGVAVTSAITSREPSANESRRRISLLLKEWLDAALAGAGIADREAAERVLELSCLAALLGIVNGSSTPRDAAEDLRRAADLVVREIQRS